MGTFAGPPNPPWAAIAASAAAIAALGLGVAVGLNGDGEESRAVEATETPAYVGTIGCNPSDVPAGVVAIGINIDTYHKDGVKTTGLQVASTNLEIRKIIEQSRQGVRYLVYRLTGDVTAPVERIGGIFCDPGADTGLWTPNARRLEAIRQETFVAPLLAAVEEALIETEQLASPIAESVAAMASDSAFVANAPVAHEMVLFTDAIPNVTGCKAFTTGTDTKGCRAYIGRNPAPLQNTDVAIFQIHRADQAIKARQGESLAQFWKAYFDQNGAKSFAFKPLR